MQRFTWYFCEGVFGSKLGIELQRGNEITAPHRNGLGSAAELLLLRSSEKINWSAQVCWQEIGAGIRQRPGKRAYGRANSGLVFQEAHRHAQCPIATVALCWSIALEPRVPYTVTL